MIHVQLMKSFFLAGDPCLTFLYTWIGYLLTMYYPLKLFQK